MFSAPSWCARRDITVNMVVPTSGNLLWNRTLPITGRQRLQAAGKRMHAESGLAQRAGGGEAALARCANKKVLDPGAQQLGVGEQRGHGDVPGSGGRRGEFLGRADIDQFEPVLCRGAERGEAHLDGGIFGGQFTNERAARCDALGAAVSYTHLTLPTNR